MAARIRIPLWEHHPNHLAVQRTLIIKNKNNNKIDNNLTNQLNQKTQISLQNKKYLK